MVMRISTVLRAWSEDGGLAGEIRDRLSAYGSALELDHAFTEAAGEVWIDYFRRRYPDGLAEGEFRIAARAFVYGAAYGAAAGIVASRRL